MKRMMEERGVETTVADQCMYGVETSSQSGKKKATDPFLKKEWYSVKAPNMFKERVCGKTLITRTQGTKIASDGLKGRVFELSLADLDKDEEQQFRKIKLCCEDVQGFNVLTNFHGMDLTRDKLCSLIKKWVTLIEANVDIKTTDGEFCEQPLSIPFCCGR